MTEFMLLDGKAVRLAFKVACSCGWQCLAPSSAKSEANRRAHKAANPDHTTTITQGKVDS